MGMSAPGVNEEGTAVEVLVGVGAVSVGGSTTGVRAVIVSSSGFVRTLLLPPVLLPVSLIPLGRESPFVITGLDTSVFESSMSPFFVG